MLNKPMYSKNYAYPNAKVLKELNGEFMDLVRSCIGDRPPVRAALMRLAQLLQPDSCGSLMKVGANKGYTPLTHTHLCTLFV